MPDKTRTTAGTGEMPRVDPAEYERREEMSRPLTMPEVEHASAATGIIPVLKEPVDETAPGERDSPSGE